jgi:hypothetical protein
MSAFRHHRAAPLVVAQAHVGGTEIALLVSMRLSAFRFLVTMVVLTASLAAAPAHAQSTSSAEPPAPPQPPETYTLHILGADALSIGVLVASGYIDSASSNDDFANGLSFVGIGGLALGGPIVHAVHGNWGRGAISLGMRVVLPVLGASIGASLADCQKDQFLCGLSEIGAGYSIGVATAIAVDAAVLARWSTFQRPAESHAEHRPESHPSAALTLAPRLIATPERAFIGVGGTFF